MFCFDVSMLGRSILGLATLGIVDAPALAQNTPPRAGDVVPDLTAFTNPALGAFEYFGEGRPNLQITVAPTEDFDLSVTVEETGFMDDSVFGQLYRYVVAFNGRGWEVLSAETLNSCYRTQTRDWQSGPCP